MYRRKLLFTFVAAPLLCVSTELFSTSSKYIVNVANDNRGWTYFKKELTALDRTVYKWHKEYLPSITKKLEYRTKVLIKRGAKFKGLYLLKHKGREFVSYSDLANHGYYTMWNY